MSSKVTSSVIPRRASLSRALSGTSPRPAATSSSEKRVVPVSRATRSIIFCVVAIPPNQRFTRPITSSTAWASPGEQTSESRISGASIRCMGEAIGWRTVRACARLRRVPPPAIACYTGRCSSRSRRVTHRGFPALQSGRRAAPQCDRRCAP